MKYRMIFAFVYIISLHVPLVKFRVSIYFFIF